MLFLVIASICLFKYHHVFTWLLTIVFNPIRQTKMFSRATVTPCLPPSLTPLWTLFLICSHLLDQASSITMRLFMVNSTWDRHSMCFQYHPTNYHQVSLVKFASYKLSGIKNTQFEISLPWKLFFYKCYNSCILHPLCVLYQSIGLAHKFVAFLVSRQRLWVFADSSISSTIFVPVYY